jgi:protoporphyrinogen oxidase
MRYAVIGAGALGLTAAMRLADQGHEVTVLERDMQPGGLASSFEVAPGIWLERFYHHFFASDRSAIRLIEELGLGSRLRWHQPASTVMVGREVHRLDSPASLLAFSPLSMVDRLRMAGGLAFLRAMPSPRPLERFTADRWMRRVFGARAHDQVWGSLLEAKFGAQAGAVSMAWMWARLHDRTAKLGYLDGGVDRVYRALADRVTSGGGRLEYGAVVRTIRPVERGLEVAWDHSAEVFDRVVSTLPPHVTSRLAGIASPASAGGFAPLSAHCLVLALDRPLTGTYWIGVPGSEGPFLAVVEHTAMVPPENYGGRHMVYLGAYRNTDDPLPLRPLGDQLAAAQPLLEVLRPGFSPDWVTGAWSFHAPNAQPIVDTAYRARIPGFDTAVAGLFNATMFQVYPHDRGQNYSIELAERVVAHLARTPASGTTPR